MSDGGDDGGEVDDIENADDEKLLEAVPVGVRMDIEAKETVQVPRDTYGDFMMTLVVDADIRHFSADHDAHPSWVCVSFCLHALNIFVQVTIAAILLLTSVEERKEPYEDANLGNFTHLLLTTQSALPEDDPAWTLCARNEVQSLWIYPLMLFIWHARMMQEIMDSAWLVAALYNLPTVRLYADSSSDDESTRKLSISPRQRPQDASDGIMRVLGTPEARSYQVVGLPRQTRILILASTVLPRLFIAFWITWVGSLNLILSNHTGTCVMKALVLQWWIGIDELLYRSFVSQSKKVQVERTTFTFFSVTTDAWNHFGSSITKLICVVFTVVGLYWGLFGNILHFRMACLTYKQGLPGNAVSENIFERVVKEVF